MGTQKICNLYIFATDKQTICAPVLILIFVPVAAESKDVASVMFSDYLPHVVYTTRVTNTT